MSRGAAFESAPSREVTTEQIEATDLRSPSTRRQDCLLLGPDLGPKEMGPTHPSQREDTKATCSWAEGVWDGVKEDSGEHVVLTDRGAVKCRAVRRLPEEQSWDVER